MKKTILILLIATISLAIDPLLLIGIQNDKAMHGAGGYIITDVLETKRHLKWYESALANYALGTIKEQIDVWCGGKWDNKDREAQMAGYIAYRLVHFEINIDDFFNNKQKD